MCFSIKISEKYICIFLAFCAPFFYDFEVEVHLGVLKGLCCKCKVLKLGWVVVFIYNRFVVIRVSLCLPNVSHQATGSVLLRKFLTNLCVFASSENMKQIFLLRGLETAAAEYRWRFSCSGGGRRWLSQHGRLTHKTSLYRGCSSFSASFWLNLFNPQFHSNCKLQRSPGHTAVDGHQSCAGRFAEGGIGKHLGGRRRAPAVPSTSHPTVLASPCPVNY